MTDDIASTPVRRLLVALALCVAPTLALLHGSGWLEDRVRVRLLLAAAALLCGLGAYRWRGAARSDRARALAVLGIFALSCGMALLRGWRPAVPARPGTDVAYVMAGLLVIPLLAWAAVLHLAAPRAGARPGDTAPAWAGRGTALAIGAATLVVLAGCSVLSRRWFAIDEVLYILQGRLFSQFRYAWHWGALPDRFFKLVYTLPVADGQISQYTPGFPALLAVAGWLGIRNYLNPMLGAAAVYATYLLGRRVYSPLAGIAAAALLATQPWFVEYGANYFSHMSALCTLVLAAWLLVGAEGDARRARAWRWAAAGALFGLAVAIRPLTGVLVSASVWLWVLIRRRLTRSEAVAMTGFVAAGAVPLLAALLAYNRLTTGSALTFGYTAALGKLAALGFGERGYVTFDEHVRPVPATFVFTPPMAAWNFFYAAWEIALKLLPPLSLLPLLGVALLTRFRFRWVSVAAFLLLPLVHYFYYSNGHRFYIELFPFLMIGAGAVVAHLWARDRRAGAALLAYLLAASTILGARQLGRYYAEARDAFSGSGFPYMERLRAAQREHGRILVFVRNPARSEPLFVPLSWFNAIEYPGAVIVARDLGAENAVLVRQFPRHVPMLVTWPSAREPAGLVPLSPRGAARAGSGATPSPPPSTARPE